MPKAKKAHRHYVCEVFPMGYAITDTEHNGQLEKVGGNCDGHGTAPEKTKRE